MKNTWLFPFIESLHLAGMALLVGTVALPKSGPKSGGTSRRNLTAWTHSGLLIVLITGALMFFADSSRYMANPAFLAKMALFVLAVAAQFALPGRGRWGRPACVLMWTLVALAGRAIADFDI